MADILIRGVSAETLAKIKERAKRNGRSLQGEALAAIDALEPYSGRAFADEVDAMRASGAVHVDVREALAALLPGYPPLETSPFLSRTII